jgi:DNA polymerase III subunit delta'
MFFTNIFGHEFQKEVLRRAARGDRVSHAYLFFGPDGIGKKLMALEFGKVLNCTLKEDSNIGQCDCLSCKKIEKEIHPDVFLVEYKGVKDIKVDQIREEVEERLFFRPFEGRFKVAIVDESHRMNPSAQNAFLKTLEEPPPDSVIVLITSQPQVLLPTIRSRCQSLEFKPLSQEVIFEEVKRRTNLSLDEAAIVSRLSGGSLGKALDLDKELLSQRKEIIMKLSNINPNHASEVLSFAESILKNSSSGDVEKLMLVFDIISLWLRDIVLIKIGFGEDSLSNRDLISVTRRFADRRSVDNILDKLRFFDKAWYALFHGNANKQIAIENLVLKITE